VNQRGNIKDKLLRSSLTSKENQILCSSKGKLVSTSLKLRNLVLKEREKPEYD